MSIKAGMAALNLEMTDKIPRTEYSAEWNCELVNKVLGTNISTDSTWEERIDCATRFTNEWDYSFLWMCCNSLDEYHNGWHTKMGFAEYDGKRTFNKEVFCPFKDVNEVLNFDPFEKFKVNKKSELIELFEKNHQRTSNMHPNAVATTGVYLNLISGPLEIFGWDMLLSAIGEDEKRFGEFLNRYAKYISVWYEALAESNVPVIMFHDDICWTEGQFLKTSFYNEYIFKNYPKLIAPLLDAKKKIVYTSDGNYTAFFDQLVKCGFDTFVMEPTTNMALFAEKYGKTHGFIGNCDVTKIMFGSKEDIYNEVKRCIDIGKKYPGFIFCTGNHIPQGTNIDNVLYYNECYEKLSKR